MSEKLTAIPPEPIEVAADAAEAVPGVPVASSGSSTPFISRAISFLSVIQKYSIIPFSAFTILHFASVIVAPALFGPETGNELIGMGRELYQTPVSEPIILGSAIAHAGSGILINLLRKILRWKKYGSSKKKINTSNSAIKTPNEKQTVEDINEGLGGLSSLLGLGSKKSWTYRYFGVSPLSFSGYILAVFLFGHVLKMRLGPLAIDGDSSFIDLSILTYALGLEKLKIMPFYTLFCFVGAYHAISGGNRYLKLFSKRARKIAYIGIYSLTVLGLVSLIRISHMPPVIGAAAARFQRYLDYP